MVGLVQDLRGGWRVMWLAPGASFGAVVALGLGVGLTTTLFSVCYAVLLKPLPYHEPDRLVILAQPNEDGGTAPSLPFRHVFTGIEVHAVRPLSAVFERTTIVELWTTNASARRILNNGEAAERLRGALVEPDFFEVIGATARLGRTFAVDDSPNDALVISHATWLKHFGADRAVVGRTVRLDGQARTIVGVLPPEMRFTYPDETEVWALRPQKALMALAVEYHVIGRLRPGVTIDQASAAISGAATTSGPAARLRHVIARPLHEWSFGSARALLALLWGAAGLLCVAACANAGLLLLARHLRRVKDTAVRASLGASVARLRRQALIENGVVGAIGTLGGVAISLVSHPLIRGLVPDGIPRIDDVRLSAYVLTFASLAGLACTVIASAAAHRLIMSRTRSGVGHLARMGLTATSDRVSLQWRRLLLTCQTALIVSLLTAAGLLLHSFVRLWGTDLGFQPSSAQVVHTRLLGATRSSNREELVARFGADLLRRVQQIPGVRDAAVASSLPFRDIDQQTWVPQTDPRLRRGGGIVAANVRYVSPEFFGLMGIPLIEGRAFADGDKQSGPPVVMLSRALGRRLFPGQSAVGQVLQWGEPYQVVGIVGDVRWRNPQEPPEPAFYLPLAQRPQAVISIVAETALDRRSFETEVRKGLRDVAPGQPVDWMTTVDQLVADAMAEQRFVALMTAAFGLLALILGAVGTFGSVEAELAGRVREIGIRVVLGAEPPDIRWLALRQGLLPVAAGVGMGLVASYWIGRSLRSFLFEIAPADPLTLIGVPCALLGTAIAASWLPVRRAQRIHPVDALRQE